MITRAIVVLLRGLVVGTVAALGLFGDYVSNTELSASNKLTAIAGAMIAMFLLVQLPDMITTRAQRMARRELEATQNRLEDLRLDAKAIENTLEQMRKDVHQEATRLADLRIEMKRLTATLGTRDELAQKVAAATAEVEALERVNAELAMRLARTASVSKSRNAAEAAAIQEILKAMFSLQGKIGRWHQVAFFSLGIILSVPIGIIVNMLYS